MGKKNDEVMMEKNLLSRINKVQGQLESTKRLSQEKKTMLMLELHSATRALESIRKFIVLQDLERIKKRFEEAGDSEGVRLTTDVTKNLSQKSSEMLFKSSLTSQE